MFSADELQSHHYTEIPRDSLAIQEKSHHDIGTPQTSLHENTLFSFDIRKIS